MVGLGTKFISIPYLHVLASSPGSRNAKSYIQISCGRGLWAGPGDEAKDMAVSAASGAEGLNSGAMAAKADQWIHTKDIGAGGFGVVKLFSNEVLL